MDILMLILDFGEWEFDLNIFPTFKNTSRLINKYKYFQIIITSFHHNIFSCISWAD